MHKTRIYNSVYLKNRRQTHTYDANDIGGVTISDTADKKYHYRVFYSQHAWPRVLDFSKKRCL